MLHAYKTRSKLVDFRFLETKTILRIPTSCVLFSYAAVVLVFVLI